MKSFLHVALSITLACGCASNENPPTAPQPDPDVDPPAAVDDLAATTDAGSTLILTWTAVGDDDRVGVAARTDLRWSDAPLDETSFDAATPLVVPAPGAAGGTERHAVGGFAAGDTVHLALRTMDAAGNISGLSNGAVAVVDDYRVWRVNAEGTGDAATIREAWVEKASTGDVILVAPGRYTWTDQGGDPNYGMIFAPRDVAGVELRSEAGPEVTIIDAEGRGRVFHLQGVSPGTGRNSIIDGFTITGGDAWVSALGDSVGGGFEFHLCSPTLRNCVFTGNRARAGGGLSQAGVGDITIENCVFEDNEADYGGGLSLFTQNSFPVIRDCVIRNNTAEIAGGGVYAGGVTARFERCLVERNTSGDKGGGFYLAGVPGTVIEHCTLAMNAAGVGGALRVVNEGRVELVSSIVAFGVSGRPIEILDADLHVGCTLVFDNPGGDGLPVGAVSEGGNLTVDPRFQGPMGSDIYTLEDDSPCLPGQHPDGAGCGLIGLFGRGDG